MNCDCINHLKDNLKLSIEDSKFCIYGNLNNGESIVLKYYGSLLNEDNNSNDIFINFGYGNMWENRNTLKMKKCEYSDINTYCININLMQKDTFYFCFMDNNNNWDLNDNSSFSFEIDEKLTTMSKTITDITVPEEEYMSKFNIMFKKITDKIINIFLNIGNLFEKKYNI
jgi:hypothetical protein